MNPIAPGFARDFLQRLHAAVNAHDPQAVAALCCDDVVWEDPAAPATLHGRDAVLRFHRDIMFPALPDAQVELIDGPYLSPDGTGAAVRLRISGTMTGPLTPPGFAPTRGPLSFETAEFSRFRGGLLVHPHRGAEHARSGTADWRRAAARHAGCARRLVHAARCCILVASSAAIP